ncbi:MAG TPA: SAM-dependent methyltransferase [Acidimicrobiia bacterium]|nr:SAM-dependent methyltransferase [Acidimicrobiia bacterium]
MGNADAGLGQVLVIGLGPGGADLVLPAARRALARTPRRFVRTARHPAVAELARHGLDFESFDARYEEGSDLVDVYASIVATLVAAVADGGTVAYAVPGSPAVAERTVAILHERARRGEIELTVVPGLSFSDLAWSRLGVDPTQGGGAHVVDGANFAAEAPGRAGWLLVAQCDRRLVLSDVKLTLLDSLPADTPVTVLARLGLPDEQVFTIPLEDLDRVVEPDHLTSIALDTGSITVAGEFARFVALMEQLRGPGGCPWDAEQTHHSLARYTLEEAYEVVEAIEALPAGAPAGGVGAPAGGVGAPAGGVGAPAGGAGATDPASAGLEDVYAALADELGDLLCQVVFHAVLAREAGAFTIVDVIDGIHTKLVRRHPHVFGDATAGTPADVVRNWEQIKLGEKGTESLVEGITAGLPSLLYTHKLLRKAASVGLDPGDAPDALTRLETATAELRGAGDDTDAAAGALGSLLAAAVVAARESGTDAESALAGWASRFRARFVRMEGLARARGVDLGAAEPPRVAQLWDEAADDTGGTGP